MSGYDDDEREKPSWREIDARKDQSKHISRERPSPKRPRFSPQWVVKQYRKEAEKLFQGKKGTEAYKKALNEVHKYHGTPKFHGVTKKFIQEYGLPDSWTSLFLLLDYKDTDTVIGVMSQLKNDYHQRSLSEMQGFKAKLEIMAMTSSKSQLRSAAQKILHEL